MTLDVNWFHLDLGYDVLAYCNDSWLVPNLLCNNTYYTIYDKCIMCTARIRVQRLCHMLLTFRRTHNCVNTNVSARMSERARTTLLSTAYLFHEYVYVYSLWTFKSVNTKLHLKCTIVLPEIIGVNRVKFAIPSALSRQSRNILKGAKLFCDVTPGSV